MTRRLVFALLALAAAPAAGAEPAAGLTCEQLFAITRSTVQHRDQGYSLPQVLAALKTVESEGKLSAMELGTLRRAITLAYLGHASPEEIAIECVNARGGR